MNPNAPSENSLRIGLLNNLRAGRNDAQVTRLLGFLRRHPDVIHVETNASQTVPEALGELAREEVDLLVINGGDGTLQRALTEILENDAFEGRVPMVAPLRGGRTNMSATDLGARRDAVRGFAELLESVERGRIAERVSPRQVLRIRHGMEMDCEVECGMFFGLGVIHRAIQLDHRVFDKPRSRRIQGAISSTLVTASLLGRATVGDTEGILSPDKVQVMIDGELHEKGEFFLLISSSLQRLFSGMRPFWGQGPGGARLTAISGNLQRLPIAAPGILRGKPGRHATSENGYTSYNAKRIDLRFDCGFTVDGELFAPQQGRTVEITADRTVPFVRA